MDKFYKNKVKLCAACKNAEVRYRSPYCYLFCSKKGAEVGAFSICKKFEPRKEQR